MGSSMTFGVALVALAAIVAPVGPAQAGPEKSTFTGAYTWSSLSVTISDGGQITGAGPSPDFWPGTIHGRVDADGTYSFTMTVTIQTIPDDFGQRGPKWIKVRYGFAGTLAFDANGNLVGTPSAGGSFVWLRS